MIKREFLRKIGFVKLDQDAGFKGETWWHKSWEVWISYFEETDTYTSLSALINRTEEEFTVEMVELLLNDRNEKIAEAAMGDDW